MYEHIKKEMENIKNTHTENIKKKKKNPNGKSGPEGYNKWIGGGGGNNLVTADLIKQKN